MNGHGRDPVGTRAPKQQNTAQGRGQMDAEMSGQAGGAEAGEAILEPPVQTRVGHAGWRHAQAWGSQNRPAHLFLVAQVPLWEWHSGQKE